MNYPVTAETMYQLEFFVAGYGELTLVPRSRD